MTKKIFNVGSSPLSPLEFEIQGTDIEGKPIEPQAFRCLPVVQGEVLTDMVGAFASGQSIAAAQISKFIKQCLVDGDVERYDELTHSKNVIIQLDTIGEILQWLVEEYSNRPTGAPSSSQAGPSTTTATSTGASQLQDLPMPAASQ